MRTNTIKCFCPGKCLSSAARGMTLVEMMIGLVLGAIAVYMTMPMLVRQDAVNTQSKEASFASDIDSMRDYLRLKLRPAGFYTQLEEQTKSLFVCQLKGSEGATTCIKSLDNQDKNFCVLSKMEDPDAPAAAPNTLRKLLKISGFRLVKDGAFEQISFYNDTTEAAALDFSRLCENGSGAPPGNSWKPIVTTDSKFVVDGFKLCKAVVNSNATALVGINASDSVLSVCVLPNDPNELKNAMSWAWGYLSIRPQAATNKESQNRKFSYQFLIELPNQPALFQP